MSSEEALDVHRRGFNRMWKAPLDPLECADLPGGVDLVPVAS